MEMFRRLRSLGAVVQPVLTRFASCWAKRLKAKVSQHMLIIFWKSFETRSGAILGTLLGSKAVPTNWTTHKTLKAFAEQQGPEQGQASGSICIPRDLPVLAQYDYPSWRYYEQKVQAGRPLNLPLPSKHISSHLHVH